MCWAASPTRISLDLLPDTLARATSDGLHAHACCSGSAAAGSWPHTTLGRDQLLNGHFYPSKNIAPHPETAGHIPSPASRP